MMLATYWFGKPGPQCACFASSREQREPFEFGSRSLIRRAFLFLSRAQSGSGAAQREEIRSARCCSVRCFSRQRGGDDANRAVAVLERRVQDTFLALRAAVASRVVGARFLERCRERCPNLRNERRLSVNIGRERAVAPSPIPHRASRRTLDTEVARHALESPAGGTWMPEEWAASGGRLVLPVEVNVTSDAVVDDFKRDSFVGFHTASHRLVESFVVVESGCRLVSGVRTIESFSERAADRASTFEVSIVSKSGTGNSRLEIRVERNGNRESFFSGCEERRRRPRLGLRVSAWCPWGSRRSWALAARRT